MELLETLDPEKKKLMEASEHHKRELEKEVKSLSEKTERMLINGLIIGGSLALTYFIIRQWSKSKSRKKKTKDKEKTAGAGEHDSNAVPTDSPSAPSMISQIGNKVINQAALILLDIAKEKLLEYLESRKNQDENS
jgi:hypothetical protein